MILRLIPTLSLLLVPAAFAASVPVPHPSPQHEEHGEHPPIEQETGQAACVGGVSGGFPCHRVEMLSRVTLEEVGASSGADNWGWHDALTGRYYALMGLDNGVAFIDVTDPAAPLNLGTLPSTTIAGQVSSAAWRDLKTYADHVFVVADGIPGHGMQVFDLTRLRGFTTPQIFSADTQYSAIGPAHNIAINEDTGYAYIVGSNTCQGGLHMVDISNPQAPSGAGCYAADGYTHDVQCVVYQGPDADYQGREMCFASNEDTLTIVDVTNKNSPRMVNRVAYPNLGFSHQGWLSEGQAFFLMSDELDELTFGNNARTLVFDVRDLDTAAFTGAHISTLGSIDHNLYVQGDYVYQANYSAGLRILKAGNLATAEMEEVAYFDTMPDSEARVFQGAWNAYPFFDNGVLLVNDSTTGLFMLRPDLAAIEGQPIDGRVSGVWVSEGLEDQGINLFVGQNNNGPVMFFTWFVYLNDEPFWLTGSAAFEMGEDSVTLTAQRLEGLELLETSTDRALRTNIGTVRIHAHACDELHVNYDFNEGFGAGELTFRPILQTEGRECP